MRITPLPMQIKPVTGDEWGREWSRQAANVQGALEGEWGIKTTQSMGGWTLRFTFLGRALLVTGKSATGYAGGETIELPLGVDAQNVVLVETDGTMHTISVSGDEMVIPSGSYDGLSISALFAVQGV
jgi:hypothetical protein